jgi:Lipocalin-like domain
MREDVMARLTAFAAAAALITGLALSMGYALGQSAKELQGTWMAVSAETTAPDGKKAQPFGPNPQGLLMFDGEGRYSLQICSANRPKFASNSRGQGTPEENKAAVLGCNPHWGRYTVSDGAIVFKIEHAMYPNWEGTEQKRKVSVAGDELKYHVPAASTGGTAEVVWKRAK